MNQILVEFDLKYSQLEDEFNLKVKENKKIAIGFDKVRNIQKDLEA